MEPAATAAASRSRILLYLLLGLCLHFRGSSAKTFSSRLIHRFSDEARVASGVSLQGVVDWPRRGSMEYYGALVGNDVHRLRSSKLGRGGRYDVLFPSEGSETAALGNDFGCCGRKQSGGYLEGIAPDGLMGLGFGDISVPSVLAKAGLIRNSFSMCFGEDNSGTILFGDDGTANQQSTPFLTYDGRYPTYIVEVERFCIGTACLGQTGFEALVDSGSSFTFLPDGVIRESQLRSVYDGYPWEYCYKASSLEMPDIPKVTIMLSMNKTFVVNNPIFNYYGKEVNMSIVRIFTFPNAENFMMGYRLVFDRENLKLGWSRSNCNELDNSTRIPVTLPAQDRPENPLPTNEQQNSPGRAVSPAVAGRAPPNPSFAPPQFAFCLSTWMYFLLLFFAFSVISPG
ncbi:Aspartic proteinase-like protein 1 [Acorus calamus]|uniref:Aspartic proteinase-like protein 1 n=1 Tax=Acorus calamus TaxID=4465 RepID=A0AAV9DMZ2_ACOCL|nr:Aspartic proteinase-like protein 1 [Acorus calamus]